MSIICVVYSDLNRDSEKRMELTRENFRSMIYYDFRRGLSRQECIDQLISTFSDKSPSYATVKRWYNEFNRVRHSLTEEFRKGRTKSVPKNQIIFSLHFSNL